MGCQSTLWSVDSWSQKKSQNSGNKLKYLEQELGQYKVIEKLCKNVQKIKSLFLILVI